MPRYKVMILVFSFFLVNFVLHELDGVIVISAVGCGILYQRIQQSETHVLVYSKGSNKCQHKDVNAEFLSLLDTVLEKRSPHSLLLVLGVNCEEVQH